MCRPTPLPAPFDLTMWSYELRDEPDVLAPVVVGLLGTIGVLTLARITRGHPTSAGWLLGPVLGVVVGVGRVMAVPTCGPDSEPWLCFYPALLFIHGAGLELALVLGAVVLAVTGASSRPVRPVVLPAAIGAAAMAIAVEHLRVLVVGGASTLQPVAVGFVAVGCAASVLAGAVAALRKDRVALALVALTLGLAGVAAAADLRPELAHEARIHPATPAPPSR
jgi:hypothetical protein